MKPYALTFLVAGLLAGPCLAAAQSVDLAPGPPKFIQIQLEFLKPGHTGAIHQRSEAAFIRAEQAANAHVYYLGMNSLSGPSRALFLSGYTSLAALEKENAEVAANSALAAGFDKASLADGELLTAYETGIFHFRSELSLRGAEQPLTSARFFEINVFHVKPGHAAEFEQIAAIYQEGFKKSMPAVQFAVYESSYGKENGGMYLVFLPYTSMASADSLIDDFPRMTAALGKGTMTRLEMLTSSAISSSQTNLFQFDPNMSFLPEAWTRTDSFWKPRPAMKPTTRKP